MNTVQPIKNLDQLHKMESYLKQQSERNYMLLRLGCYSGLRISDILKLKVKDLRNQDYFILKENKTGKPKRLFIQPNLKTEITNYIKNMKDEDYIIGSQKYSKQIVVKNSNKQYKKDGEDRYITIQNESSNSPIQRVQAYRIINQAAKKVGIKGNIGTHSMRKTFGYHFYMAHKNESGYDPVSILQIIFNHKDRDTTLRYIGVMQENIDDMMRNFIM